jgi:PAS domain S-box-containing protein
MRQIRSMGGSASRRYIEIERSSARMHRRGRTRPTARTIQVLPASPVPAPPVAPVRYDVVALVTSAGGLEAVGTVLGRLPDDFPTAIIVAQHLGGQGSALVEILGRRTSLPVAWATAGAPLAPGKVLVSPARRQLEILPDGTCAIGADITVRDKPHDVLLESIADSYGARALVVVLTGMGKDAAAGAAVVKRAGGLVLVQSAETAEQPSMPRGAIASGAADLVLPLHEIASVIVQVVRGGELPRPRTELEAADALFGGEGEVPRLLRAMDWARTPLGPVRDWPVSLRTALRLVLDSPMAMIVLWGPDHIQLYNDHYRLLMGSQHPAGLGQPNRECWPEVWPLNEPLFARVRAGESVALSDALYPITRRATLEDAWFDVAYAPVRDETAAVAGVLETIVETTDRVLSQRRLRALQAPTAESAGATQVHLAIERGLAAVAGGAGVGGSGQDLPFALVYLVDAKTRQAQLATSVGAEAGGPMAPRTIDLRPGHHAWPLASVLAREADRGPLLLEDLAERFRGFRVGPHGVMPDAAMLLPLCPVADEPPTGILICGLNPRLVLDDAYRGFLRLVASAMSASLAEAQIREKERERLDRLAELDRIKTEFFSNISHEFRTPLTLLLGPLEELVHRQAELPDGLGEEIRVATRNARRLLTLVNTLLDFSQVEAQRLRPHYEATDLATLTRDIASVFRSAADRAGLGLTVSCPPLAEPVWVDRRMWERIVSNLLSNALKFTFTGGVAVELHPRARHAELIVSDTGVGIPAGEQAHVFKRFHRVQGRVGRTSEGSGIGLALVHELVRLHHGRVRVRSEDGRGSTFTVWIPMGRRPRQDPGLGPDVSSAPAAPADVAAALAEEANGWITEAAPAPADLVADDLLGPLEPASADRVTRARVLVVDDNADLRDYLRRLLATRWEVSVAGDGAAALGALAASKTDVVLADVMMPGLDGFELLERIRSTPGLEHTPVVLVTARTGEQAAIDGLRAGADDYIAKPFSPRELVARLHAVIERSRADTALRERTAWARGQREALSAAVNGAPLVTSLGALVRTIVDTLGNGIRAAFYLANPEGTALYHVVGMPLEYAGEVDGFRIHPDSLACGLAAATGEPVLTADVMTEPRWKPWRRMAERFDYRGCWSFPFQSSAGRLLGTLALYSRQPQEPTARELELASLLSQTASLIVERKRAEETLRASESRLGAELADARRLQQVSGLMIEPRDSVALPRQVLDAAIAFGAADSGSVQLLNHAGQLELIAWSNLGPEAVEHWRKVSPGSPSTCGSALRDGRRTIVTDSETDAALEVLDAEGVRQYRRFGIRAVQSTPLVTREGRLVGMLSTHWREPHAPDERELRLLDILARQAADFFDRQRTVEALLASEDRQRQMANVPGVGILTFDEATGVLLDANEPFLAISGYTREQVERGELTWERMTPPDHVSDCEHELGNLAGMGRTGPYEQEYLRADGSRSWLLFVGASAGNGRIVEYCIDLVGRERSAATR